MPATTDAARHGAPSATLPIVAIGKHDLTFEAGSVQNLEALADTELLREIGTANTHNATASRALRITGRFACKSGLAPGTERGGAMWGKRSMGGVPLWWSFRESARHWAQGGWEIGE